MPNVLIVGFGTIGEPLTVLLTNHREDLGIADVIFYKHSPREMDRPDIAMAQKRGAKLSVAEEKLDEFKKIGINPDMTIEEARNEATIIVDCTPKRIGRANKEKYYDHLLTQGNLNTAIFQGSEDGAGKKYAFGINDDALIATGADRDRCIQVVSCNTHNLAVVSQLLAGDRLQDLVEADFTCIRRASDVSQTDKGPLSPKVDVHKDARFGTHHAKDARELYQTLNVSPKFFSSAMIVPTQMMHVVRFRVRVNGSITVNEIIDRCMANERIAITHKDMASHVFSVGRDHSNAHGRILNPAVVATPTLSVIKQDGTTDVTGFCFTPQDGNSLISSVAAICWSLHPDSYLDCLSPIKQYLFQEV